MNELFENFGALFGLFQWWSLLLILGTTLLMIPLNLLLKKIMQKDSLQRLRKMTAFLSVYGVALGVVSLFTVIVGNQALSYGYLSGSTIALGFCAQVLWEIIKLLKTYGWEGLKKLTAYIAENVDWKKALNEISSKYGIDSKIIDLVATQIETQYLSSINTDAIKTFADNEIAMVSEIQTKLEGFVNSENLAVLATGVYSMLKESWGASTETKTTNKVTTEVTDEVTDETK